MLSEASAVCRAGIIYGQGEVVRLRIGALEVLDCVLSLLRHLIDAGETFEFCDIRESAPFSVSSVKIQYALRAEILGNGTRREVGVPACIHRHDRPGSASNVSVRSVSSISRFSSCQFN